MAKKGAAQQGSGAKRPKRLSYEERQRVGGCAIHFCSIAVPALELTICVPAGRGARGVALSGRQHHRRAGRGRRCSAHRQPRSAGEHARCPTCQAVKVHSHPGAHAAPRRARCWGQEAGRGGAEAADAGEDEDADAAALVWEDRTGATPALAQRPDDADADADAEPASSADGEAAGAPRYDSSEDGDTDEDRGGAGGASGGGKMSLDASEEEEAGEGAAATAAAPGPRADEQPGAGADGDERLDGPRAAWEDRAGGGGGAAPAARRPVWEDPDDASQAVNVAGRNRLRKLRRSEDEGVLTGARAPSAACAHCARRPGCCGTAAVCAGAWQRALGGDSGR